MNRSQTQNTLVNGTTSRRGKRVRDQSTLDD